MPLAFPNVLLGYRYADAVAVALALTDALALALALAVELASASAPFPIPLNTPLSINTITAITAPATTMAKRIQKSQQILVRRFFLDC